ncbi:MAG: MFS transporter [Candidatus Omnitrophica bacterium]|nr:MFS transporter [Candidatus Omnitrophota bacterium]
MPDPSAEEKKKKNLTLSLWDGVFAAVNTGCGETYVSPFAIALGAGNLQVGLLASLPNLIASLLQLRAPGFVRWAGSRKKIINLFVGLQTFMWLPILGVPFLPLGGYPVEWLIFFYACYTAFGAFSTPAWGSLMSDSVPEKIRGKYFGLRGKLIGAVTVLSGFAAGFALYAFSSRLFVAFAAVFAVSAMARTVSNILLSRHYDPPLKTSDEHHFSFLDFLRRMPKSNFAKYVLYIGLFHLSAHMAGPYFAVLMLRDFGFSYLTYTVLITAASVSSLLGLTYWGKHADELGNARLFKISGFLISFLPALWVVSHHVVYLFVIQLAAGYLWGGFNLCCANFIFDAAQPEKRVSCIAYYNVINGTGIFLGVLLGGWLIGHAPPVRGYQIFPVLLISSLLRLLVSMFLLPRVREVREVKKITKRDLFLTITGLGPSEGLTDPSFLSLKKGKRGGIE